MKKKLCITSFLIAAIAFLPYRPARAQQKDPNVAVEVVCTMIVIGVTAWIGYSVYKACKRLPPPPQIPDDEENPPPPPAPPPKPNAASVVPAVPLSLDDQSGVLYWDCSTNNWTDPVSGLPVTAIMKTTIQSSVDFTNWSEEVSLLGYCSDNGVLMVLSRSGLPICTNYLPMSATNVVNLNLEGKLTPYKFYRLAAP